MDIGEIRRQVESFRSEAGMEWYRGGAGLKDRVNMAAVFGRHPGLFSRESIDAAASALAATEDAPSGEGLRLGRLRNFLTVGFIREALKELSDAAVNFEMAARQTTAEVVESVLGLEMEELDQAFVEHFEARFERPLASLDEAPPAAGLPNAALDSPTIARLARENPNNFLARLRAGIKLFEEGRTDDAEPHLRAAVRLFPEYGGPRSAYWYLSQIHEARGELEQAAAALARLNALNESDYRARIEQANILERLGDLEAAADALQSGVFIFPYEIDLHRKLAEAHASQGNTGGVVRERQAVVALDPTDRAEAFYLLAVAFRANNDLAAARRTVLRALDVAPNYAEALELLLDLRSGTENQPIPRLTGRAL